MLGNERCADENRKLSDQIEDPDHVVFGMFHFCDPGTDILRGGASLCIPNRPAQFQRIENDFSLGPPDPDVIRQISQFPAHFKELGSRIGDGAASFDYIVDLIFGKVVENPEILIVLMPVVAEKLFSLRLVFIAQFTQGVFEEFPKPFHGDFQSDDFVFQLQ